MSPSTFLGVAWSVCFPRVSGDEPAYVPGTWAVDMFSPRERG